MMDPYEFRPWYPKGIHAFVAAGANHYVALHGTEETVLKFPLVSPEEEVSYSGEGLKYRQNLRETTLRGLAVEKKILQRLGHHPRIIRLEGEHEDGLLLEFARNGSIEKYLRKFNTEVETAQRLLWAQQAADGLAHIHRQNILHCDFSIGNLLLDESLHIKICDFQGRILDTNGNLILDGGAIEGSMFSMPRQDRVHCDKKTDIFALGTIIYFIMTGQLPFPALDTIDDEDEIRRRFEKCEYPPLIHLLGGHIVRKCWMGGYEMASEVFDDLQSLQS